MTLRYDYEVPAGPSVCSTTFCEEEVPALSATLDLEQVLLKG